MINKDNSKLKNPNSLRISNQLQVVEYLKRKPQSCLELGKKLNLSNVALKKITDELLKENIIYSYIKEDRIKQKGRTPAIFALNEDVGVFCVMDFSRRDLIVAIADINDNILVSDYIYGKLYIDEEALKEASILIKKLLKNEAVRNRKLLGICISTPGELDLQTKNFTYAPRIVNHAKMNFVHYFGDIFHVPVDVCNDVNLGLQGEYYFGNSIPKDAKNVYYVFLDYVAGSALMLNGEIFFGTRGHAGEPASYKELNEDDNGYYSGRFFTIFDIYKEIHLLAKDYPDDEFYKQEVFNFKDIVQKYHEGDKVVLKVIEKSARINAIQFLAASNLLDLDYVCVEGKMLELGDSYKNLLCHYFREFDANSNCANITFSTCGKNANIYGAIQKASNTYFVKKFVELANKRTGLVNNDVEDLFISKI